MCTHDFCWRFCGCCCCCCLQPLLLYCLLCAPCQWLDISILEHFNKRVIRCVLAYNDVSLYYQLKSSLWYFRWQSKIRERVRSLARSQALANGWTCQQTEQVRKRTNDGSCAQAHAPAYIYNNRTHTRCVCVKSAWNCLQLVNMIWMRQTNKRTCERTSKRSGCMSARACWCCQTFNQPFHRIDFMIFFLFFSFYFNTLILSSAASTKSEREQAEKRLCLCVPIRRSTCASLIKIASK